MLRTLFVSLILIPGFVWALRDRFVALLLYLWYGFFRPQDWIWVDISALRLSLVLGLMLVVPAIFSGQLPNLTHPLSIGNAVFLVSALISQSNAVDQTTGWVWIDFLARLTVVCLLTVTLVTTPARFLWVLAVSAGSLAFFAGKAGVVSLVGGGVRFAEGLSGSFTDNNGYALGTVMIIPLLLAVAANASLMCEGKYRWLEPWIRRGFFAAVPFCAFTVISTYSRGGFLALTAAMLVYIALHRRRVRLSLGLAALAVVGVSVIPIPEGYFERVETIGTYDEIGEASALGRIHFWAVALRMVDEQPLGIGLRNFESTYDLYDFSYGLHGTRRAVHSSHLQVLAELGYLGAAVWVFQFAVAFAVALRVRRRSRAPGLSPSSSAFMYSAANCLIASMIGFVVGGSFISLALNDVTWLTFALVASLDRMTANAYATVPALPPAAVPARSNLAWPRPGATGHFPSTQM